MEYHRVKQNKKNPKTLPICQQTKRTTHLMPQQVVKISRCDIPVMVPCSREETTPRWSARWAPLVPSGAASLDTDTVHDSEKIISHINMENTTLFIYVTGTVF
jgi:hypothetical protein